MQDEGSPGFTELALDSPALAVLNSHYKKQVYETAHAVMLRALVESIGEPVAHKATVYCNMDNSRLHVSASYAWGGVPTRWACTFTAADVADHSLFELLNIVRSNLSKDAARTMQLSGRYQNDNLFGAVNINVIDDPE